MFSSLIKHMPIIRTWTGNYYLSADPRITCVPPREGWSIRITGNPWSVAPLNCALYWIVVAICWIFAFLSQFALDWERYVSTAVQCEWNLWNTISARFAFHWIERGWFILNLCSHWTCTAYRIKCHKRTSASCLYRCRRADVSSWKHRDRETQGCGRHRGRTHSTTTGATTGSLLKKKAVSYWSTLPTLTQDYGR